MNNIQLGMIFIGFGGLMLTFLVHHLDKKIIILCNAIKKMENKINELR